MFEQPRTFESLEQYAGFLLYETQIPLYFQGKGKLVVEGLHDRAIVFLNKVTVNLNIIFVAKIRNVAFKNLK